MVAVKAAGSISSRPERAAWLVVGAGLLGGFFVYLVRYSLAVLVPDLMITFAIGAGAVGILGSVYFWTYAPMQIPAGVLADTLGPRRSIATFFVIAALGALTFALAPTYALVLVGAALGGLGVSVGYVCTARLIASWFPANYFAVLIGSWTAIGSIGSLIAATPLAWLVSRVGWRGSLTVLAALLLAYAATAVLVIRDQPGSEPKARAAEGNASLAAGLAELARCRNTWTLGPYGFLTFGTMIVLQALWGVTYLIDAYGYSRGHASAILSMWAIGLLIGAPLAGLLADQVLRVRKPVVVWGTIGYAIVWLILALRPSGLPEAALWPLFFAGGLSSAAWTPSIAQFKDSVSPSVVGSAVGIFNFCFFLGAAILQPLSGAIIGHYPRFGSHIATAGYAALFRFGLAAIVIAAICAALSREQTTQRPERR